MTAPDALIERLHEAAECLKYARAMSIKPETAAQVETVKITARESDIIRATLIDSADRIESLLARIEAAEKVIEPFAEAALHEVGDDESDNDLFRPMIRHNRAGVIKVGHFRAAAQWRQAGREGEG